MAREDTVRGVSAGEIAAGVAAVIGVGALGAASYLLWSQRSSAGEGDAAPDLGPRGEPGAGGRAPVAFRPDPTAAVPASEREAMRPASAGPVPVTG